MCISSLKFAELSFQKRGSNSTKELSVDIYLYVHINVCSVYRKCSQRNEVLLFHRWTHWNTDQLIIIAVVAVAVVVSFRTPMHFQSISLCLRYSFGSFFLMFAHHFPSTDSIIHNLYLFYVEDAERCREMRMEKWNEEEEEETKEMKKMLVIILWVDIRLHVHDFDRCIFWAI